MIFASTKAKAKAEPELPKGTKRPLPLEDGKVEEEAPRWDRAVGKAMLGHLNYHSSKGSNQATKDECGRALAVQHLYSSVQSLNAQMFITCNACISILLNVFFFIRSTPSFLGSPKPDGCRAGTNLRSVL